MPATNDLQWANPATWPFPFWIWIASVTVAVARALWRRYLRILARGWPMATGTVESAEVTEPGPGFRWTRRIGGEIAAELKYSYMSPGGRYSGSHQRRFGCAEDAYEFIRDLPGKPVMVHYRPDRQERSQLDEDSLEMLLRNRAPVVVKPEDAGQLEEQAEGGRAWRLPLAAVAADLLRARDGILWRGAGNSAVSAGATKEGVSGLPGRFRRSGTLG
jgi:hypothetical protein